ncbi:MAG: hypothetical protein KGZ39_01730 [Simkania sp.]|nr:hypothetical protein [Simkania sp.]
MNFIPAPTMRERAEFSTRDSSSRPRPERFQDYVQTTVEKTEDQKQKRPSIFEIASEQNALAAPPPLFSLTPCATAQESLTVGSINHIPYELLAEMISSSITHLISNGDKETSMYLEGNWCRGTVLEGVQIVIKEFSTAPLAYNITLRCSPTTLLFLQPHLSALSAALHQEKRPYAIHHLEVELGDTSQFLFHRKSAPDNDQQNPGDHRDQQG